MRILVIEDEHKIANAIKQGLMQEKYAVDVEYDGDSGLGAALNESYDVLIIDRMLPGSLEGLDICRQVRQADIHTPILLLTAKDQTRDKVEGLNAGADDYLVKPFSFEELLARIRALMRRPAKTSETVLKVGDLTLDPVAFEVKRDGKKVDLSAKEFALLEYMMRNSGRVLTKDNIISHVWEIDKPFKTPLLKTQRGFGYVLGVNT
jgi:DNA-binding response OmpR family regulator